MVNYEIVPLPLVKLTVNRGYETYFMNYDKTVEIAHYVWYIRGPRKNIIVDTGCPVDIVLKHRAGAVEITPFEEALGRVGLTPDKINVVLQTQLHFDHCGNNSKCRNAEFIVQKKEVDFALAPHPLFAHLYDRTLFSRSKLHWVNGDTQVDEGIQLLLTPGHSPGGQSVAVSTAKGTAIITGFCCIMDNFVMPKDISGYSFESLEELESRWPVRAPGIHTDAIQAFNSALRVKGLADIIVPVHDAMWMKVEKIPG